MKEAKKLLLLLLLQRRARRRRRNMPLLISPTINNLATNTKFGIGRGRGPRCRKLKLNPVDVYSKLKVNPNRFYGMYRMSIGVFKGLVKNITDENPKLRMIIPSVTIKNKFLLVFDWIYHYSDYSNLSIQYGSSKTSIGTILNYFLPIMASYFKSFIPNKFSDNPSRSWLSNKIIGVIDGKYNRTFMLKKLIFIKGTIHRISKPKVNQSEEYNGHYKMHGVLSIIVCDFEKFSIGFQTAIPGNFKKFCESYYSNLLI